MPTPWRPCSRRRQSFASGVLAPINWLGDRQGVRVVDDAVQVPAEFTDAYAKFCEGGWPGIAGNPDFGGQGLPKTVAVACDEMWAAANVAFALCPELSQGAILAMDRHATDELKADLPREADLRAVDRHDVPDRSRRPAPTWRPHDPRRAARAIAT